MIELLCSILSPIGAYRSNHITPSKGKRSKKRKRRDTTPGDEKSSETPPPPEISSYVVTGLNSIHRILEESSKKILETKETLGSPETETSPQTNEVLSPNPQNPPQTHFSAIFVARSNQPSILNAHLPQIIATASKAHPANPSTRLVQLPKGSETRIAAALGLPRVSFLGILDDAPRSKALIDLIRNSVEEIDIPWLDEAKKAEYLETKINSIQTSIGPVKAK
ncbi:RNase P and RNase MRP subunit [Ciborinia camelliae]|nr:RNase P and RNase MRP subunit [Ciborinia camelliae]